MDISTCPFCNQSIPSIELQKHANDHFADEDVDKDFQLAQQIALVPPPIVEDFTKCRPSSWDSSQASSSRCDAKPIACGENNNDDDDKYASAVCLQKKAAFYKVEDSLMTLLRKCLELETGNSVSIVSGHIDHFQGTEWDAGWGCGWRNIQMLSSYLLSERQESREVMFGGSGFVPNIESLQRWLELAWEKGFDTSGSDDFDHKIYGKRTWIGTTECAALFRSFGLRARIVDFCVKGSQLDSSAPKQGFDKRKITDVYGPMDVFLSKGKLDVELKVSSENESYKLSSDSSQKVKGHQVLTEWVWNYFSGHSAVRSGNNRVVLSDKTPLYFQHDGHSRTIVGIQAKFQKNGTQQYNLLIFDPKENTRALEKSLRENFGWQQLIKRGVHTLKKPQYQLCFIDPGIAHEEELEELKTLHSIRHEF